MPRARDPHRGRHLAGPPLRPHRRREGHDPGGAQGPCHGPPAGPLGLSVAGRTSPIYGPEPWEEVAGEVWSHWDLWFCLVCVTDFGEDWRALEEAVVVGGQRRSFGGRGWEAKDSHLHDLEALTASQLGNKTVLAKARRKVLEQGLAGRDLTPAMRNTPRDRLRTRALRGHWDLFPVSPAADCEVFEDRIEKARSRRRGSSRTAADLEELARRLEAELADRQAARLALWRGLVTAIIEAFEQGQRDPEGAIARCGGDAIARYAGLPWERAGLAASDFYRDLCEVCVWDDWALLDGRDTTPFHRVRRRDVALVEEILRQLETEHRAGHLKYQADHAAQHVAWLHVATRSFDRFVPTAERLGSDWWMPVTALAETAVAAGKTELAVSVFAAATSRAGVHRDLLAQKRFALTGRSLESRRHLQVVK